MTMANDPCPGADHDAVALARLVRSGEASAVELVERAITAVEAADAALGFLVAARFDEALAEARDVAPDAPLAGVPVLVKDFLATVAGTRHTEGSAFLVDHVADRDSDYVVRLKRAGAVIIGSTKTSELALLATTEPRVHGPTRNPWDRSRTPGGSSGGSAAAVAAGVVPVAHGSDAGGSLRIPAACCGVFGLKPTRGRNPLGPEHGDLDGGVWAEHVISRSVRDSAAFLDATAGASPGDPYCAPWQPEPFAAELQRPPGRLRIAVSTTAPSGLAAAPAQRDAVLRAAALLEDLGHDVVVDVAPSCDLARVEDEYFKLLAEGAAARVDLWADRTGRRPAPDELEPYTWAMTRIGRQRTGADHLLGRQLLQRESRRIAAFYADHDVWMTPTLPGQPPVLGAFDASDGDPLAVMAKDGEIAAFTWLANVTGQPAMSVPLGQDLSGLPVAVHVTGRYGAEATLLRLAAQLEAAVPWAGARPAEA
ncbi:MAG TPA: amidase [Capillimicrobium sp.]|nr:amidase [Capillimicrobium sp.]